MNVLFLGISASIKGPRDGITYPFIVKEMRALLDRGANVYFLARHIDKHDEIDGVTYLSLDELVGRHRLIRLMKLVGYVLRHLSPLLRLAACDINKTKNVIFAEIGIARALSQFDIDILHSHFLWPSGESGVLSASDCRVPVVATLRGAELVDRPDLDYGAMTNPFNRVAATVAFPRISYFTVPNRHLSDVLANEYKVPKDRVIYLPNGVEKMEAPAGTRHAGERLQLLAIGRVIKLKNHRLLVDVANLAEDLEFEIIIVGEGLLRDQLQREIEERGQQNIRLHREVTKAELYEMMLAADCIVHPSLCEGMPNVVLEAFALGRPCLASDIPVHRELIEEGVNGWLFDPHDASALLTKIREIARRKDVLPEMEDECRRVAARYSLSTKTDGYLDIYQQVSNSMADRRA